ncbi:MAG: hypothetical protein PUC11_02085 [Elusimicrobia bacterium]|nr:hypothetical protein [Elusimicrobiota bacterium]
MYTWLSRFMTAVFLLNILSPAYAQAPLPRRRSVYQNPQVGEAQRQADIARGVVQGLEESRQKYLDNIAPDRESAHDEFLNSSTFEEMAAAYKKLDELRRKGSKTLSTYQTEINGAQYRSLQAAGGVTFEYYRQNPHVALDAVSQMLGYDPRFGSNPNNWLAWADSYSRLFRTDGCPSASSFLDNLKNNKFETTEELLEYIDPLGFNCNDYLAVAYAAETMYYMLEEFTRPGSVSDEQREEMTVFFSHARYRAVASLKRLNRLDASDETLYMARGMLRILLAILEEAASANNLQLLEKKLYLLEPTKKLWQKNYPQPSQKTQTVGEGRWISVSLLSTRPSYKTFVQNHTQVVEELSAELTKAVSQGYVKVQEVTYSDYWGKNPLEKFVNWVEHAFGKGTLSHETLASLREGIPGDLDKEFYDELVDLKGKASGPESKEFALLQLAVQYAAQFAVLTGNERLLKDMLALFEDSSSSDMKTTYSEVLAALFNSIYETLRGFNVSNNYTSAIMFLLDAAKESHATNTRVLAAATLGRLTEKPDSVEHAPMRAEFLVSQEGEVVNKYWLSYEDRFYVAQSVADLYAPLQNTSRYGMQDYGLNSDEMVSLSNELVGIYMQFLPLEAPTVTLGRCGRVEKMDTENRRIITAGDLRQTKEGVFRDADCQYYYTNGGVFVFGSRYAVEMTTLNDRNSRKYEQEITNKGMEIFGEALMWVFGGALMGGAFRGLRLLAGVPKSLPRAVRSGKLVYNATKGTRVYRWTAAAKRARASVKVGSKYMSDFNFNAHLAKNGMAYNVTTSAAKPGLVKTTTAVSHGAAPRIPSPSTRVTVTAADAASGLARQATFGVNPNITRWSVPVQRAQFLRFTQQQGLRNVWSSADRIMFQRSVMWRNAHNKLWGDFAGGKLVRPGEPFRFPDGVSLPYYPGSILAEHPLVNAGLTAYGQTLRFFGAWKAGDILAGIAIREPFNLWMLRQQEEAVNAEAAKHGDSLSPEALAEVNAQNSGTPQSQPGDVLTRVGGTLKEPFGWINALTFPSYLWQSIAPSDMDKTDGSLILPPFMIGRAALAEAGVVSNPFITDAVKQQLAINAHRIDLARARIAKANNQLAEVTEANINAFAEQRATLQQTTASLKAAFPDVDWAADERAFLTVLNNYEQALHDTEKITNISDRSKQVAAVIKQYDGQLVPMYEQFAAKQYDASVSSQLDVAIKDWVDGLEDDLFRLQYFGLDSSHPELCVRLNEIYMNVINGLKAVQRKAVSGQVKAAEARRYIQEFKQAIEVFGKEVDLLLVSKAAAGDVSAEDKSELYPEESTEVPSQAY